MCENLHSIWHTVGTYCCFLKKVIHSTNMSLLHNICGARHSARHWGQMNKDDRVPALMSWRSSTCLAFLTATRGQKPVLLMFVSDSLYYSFLYLDSTKSIFVQFSFIWKIAFDVLSFFMPYVVKKKMIRKFCRYVNVPPYMLCILWYHACQ